MSSCTEGFYAKTKRIYGETTVKKLKRWTNLVEKLATAEARRTFLLECRRTRKIPRFIIDCTSTILSSTTGTISQTIQHLSQSLNRQVRARLLNFHISKVHSDIKFITNQIKNITEFLDQVLPVPLLDTFETSLHRKFNFYYQKSILRLQKKLDNLDTPEFHKIPFNPKWIKNLSNVDVPQDILKLLSLGPKFGLQPSFKDYSVNRILADVENILSYADDSDLLSLRSYSNNILLNYTKRPKHSILIIDSVYRETVSFLKNHPNLLVLTSDKGNATVLMDRDQYISLSQSLLDDSRYYQLLPSNPCSKFTNRINKFITHLKDIKVINQTIAKSLHNYDGYSPRFYCLPKIHKPTLSMRPIVSSINSPNIHIAKFLTDILSKSYDYHNSYNIFDSFQFSAFINNFKLPLNYILNAMRDNNWENIGVNKNEEFRNNSKFADDIDLIADLVDLPTSLRPLKLPFPKTQ
ncbi:uncharacterized protein [Diabrotica undecimpunctata]|uniref:uncharacterized protein n=1 Tax=Diabrotica undecimpunctata TaxID=50387 RepID=UPI003B631E60